MRLVLGTIKSINLSVQIVPRTSGCLRSEPFHPSPVLQETDSLKWMTTVFGADVHDPRMPKHLKCDSLAPIGGETQSSLV